MSVTVASHPGCGHVDGHTKELGFDERFNGRSPAVVRDGTGAAGLSDRKVARSTCFRIQEGVSALS